ncbi:MAG: hypothetical protein V7682_10790 [Cycloclasticus sp.]
MKELFLFQTGSTLIIYLLFFLIPWLKSWRKKESGKAYFIGLLFATLLYYGTPVWLWLYGWRTTLLLIISCIGTVFVIAVIIGIIFSVEETFVIGIFLQVPIRVIAGGWLANNHVRLRSKIIA